MSSPGSVTLWIGRLKAGDRTAAQVLWERYFRRLVGLARKKLRGSPRRVSDEEDVALNAFHSLWSGILQGRFPQLDDRHDLWRILVVLTERKAISQAQSERRLKRGGARQGEAALPVEAAAVEQIISQEPTPEFATQFAEEVQRLLGLLNNAELRLIAMYKMESYTTAEIAAKLRRAPRTIERRLQLIRKAWECEIAL